MDLLDKSASFLTHSRRIPAPFLEGNCSLLALAGTARLAILITPRGRGTFRQQTEEVLAVTNAIVSERPQPAVVTVQTVFLRDAHDQAECEQLFAEHYGGRAPITHFVVQPPCCGAALAVESWAISGRSVRLERYGSHTLAVTYDGMRWIYAGGVTARAGSAHTQTTECLHQLRALLGQARSGFHHVVRTWIYVGGITEPERGGLRYHEVNRARSEFYREFQFATRNGAPGGYPASTGIGVGSPGVRMGCIALETQRRDVALVPLENPHQTSAYAYEAKYSPYSPKFSRGVAMVAGDYLTAWISGTASIVNSDTRYPGDVVAQTEQTIENIEHLIAPQNFARHGLNGAGATLRDLARIRVYLKRAKDLRKCRAVCERRFGAVPAIYVEADICRPDLLVEIEGVAFAKCSL